VLTDASSTTGVALLESADLVWGSRVEYGGLESEATRGRGSVAGDGDGDLGGGVMGLACAVTLLQRAVRACLHQRKKKRFPHLAVAVLCKLILLCVFQIQRFAKPRLFGTAPHAELEKLEAGLFPNTL
jgi:hypothetical protein